MDDGPAQQANAHEGEHKSRHQLTGRAADQDATHQDDGRAERGAAEHLAVASVERLAGEQPGEGRGDRMFGLPEEQIEQEPAEKHDADHGGEKRRTRLEGKPGHIVDRPQAERKPNRAKAMIAARKESARADWSLWLNDVPGSAKALRPSLPRDGRAGRTGRR